jgi:hypothetical protein
LSSYYQYRTQETYFLPAFYLFVITTLPLYYIRRPCLTYSIPPVALQATIANIGTGQSCARDYRPYTSPCTYLAISSYYTLILDFQPQSRTGNLRKRGPSAPIDNLHIDKNPRTSVFPTSQAEHLILQARDLLIQAYSVTTSREQQTRLLDLVEVFREYTELGCIRHTLTILATQIANLEQTSRKIELQARQNQQKQPKTVPNTWAKVASLATTAAPIASVTILHVTSHSIRIGTTPRGVSEGSEYMVALKCRIAFFFSL